MNASIPETHPSLTGRHNEIKNFSTPFLLVVNLCVKSMHLASTQLWLFASSGACGLLCRTTKPYIASISCTLHREVGPISLLCLSTSHHGDPSGLAFCPLWLSHPFQLASQDTALHSLGVPCPLPVCRQAAASTSVFPKWAKLAPCVFGLTK